MQTYTATDTSKLCLQSANCSSAVCTAKLHQLTHLAEAKFCRHCVVKCFQVTHWASTIGPFCRIPLEIDRCDRTTKQLMIQCMAFGHGWFTIENPCILHSDICQVRKECPSQLPRPHWNSASEKFWSILSTSPMRALYLLMSCGCVISVHLLDSAGYRCAAPEWLIPEKLGMMATTLLSCHLTRVCSERLS